MTEKGIIVFTNKLIVIVGIILLCPTFNLYAAPGETALDFLNIPVGAHTAALGQANYAGIIGPEAIFANPSLLGSRTGGFASHQELFMDTRSEAASVALRVSPRYSLGFGINMFEPGNIVGYSANDIKTGNIAAGDYMGRLAFVINGKITYGASISYYHQKLADISGSGLGFGFGATYENNTGRFALSFDNFGANFGIGNSKAPLPSRLALSTWIPLWKNNVNINADLIYNRAFGWKIAGGVEYRIVNGFSLRAGSNNADPLSLGFNLGIREISFDYSYIPLGTFGDRHIFSVSIFR